MSDGPEIPEQYADLSAAFIALIGATGAKSIELRYSDDDEPVVWMAVGAWPIPEGEPDHHEAAGGLNPVEALLALGEKVIDGGDCPKCKRGTALSDSFTGEKMPAEKGVCWWKYDPTLKAFLRGCDGKHAGAKS